MQTRPYGRTGKRVSEIGFGAWQLGNDRDWAGMGDEEAIALVREAVDLGVRFFDSSPNYGRGASETLLGRALRGSRERVVLNTKFGHSAEGGTDYSAGRIRESLEQSLLRLQTDHVDSLLLHNPPFDYLDGKYGHYEVLEELKQEGKLLAYGASVDSSRDMREAMRHPGVGVLEVMFNLFHQETAEAFAEARDKGIALIVKVPLDSGWLSGKFGRDSRFEGVRRRWSPEEIERRSELVDAVKSIVGEAVPLSISALRFILAYPEVATVIPGMRDSRQLRDNLAASGEGLRPEVLHRLRQWWQEELRDRPLGW